MKGASIHLKIHIVQKGDTLWEIAKKYGVDFEQLKQINSQLSSPDMIMPGMKIKIPSTAKSVKKETSIKKTQMKKEKTVPSQAPPKELDPMTIEEDDLAKKQKIQPQMPQIPQMQPMMQAPKMEQQMNQYTTIKLPEMMPYSPAASQKEVPVQKKMKKKPMPHTIPNMMPAHMHHPMYHPVFCIPVCCP